MRLGFVKEMHANLSGWERGVSQHMASSSYNHAPAFYERADRLKLHDMFNARDANS